MSAAGSNDPSDDDRDDPSCTWCSNDGAVHHFAIVSDKESMIKDGSIFKGKEGDEAYELWKYEHLEYYLHSCTDHDCVHKTMVQLANVSKGCAVDYDKYSKMLAINNNHKYDDADFNEFVPATTEEEYVNLKRKMVTMKKDYLHEQNSLVFCGVLHQYPILDSRFSTAKNRQLQKLARQLSVSSSSQLAKSMAGSGGTGNCVFIGP